MRLLKYVLALIVPIAGVWGATQLWLDIGERPAERAIALIRPAPPTDTLILGRARHDLTGGCVRDRTCAPEHAPIGAYAEYRRCGGVVATWQDTGEAIACSQSWITDRLGDFGLEGQTIYRQLRRACFRHDLCYAHGATTYGLIGRPELADTTGAAPGQARHHCDHEFFRDGLATCPQVYEGGRLRNRCAARAGIAYLAVSAFGATYYKTGYRPHCDYEMGPYAARDQVVAGRFGGGLLEQVAALELTPDRRRLRLSVHRLDVGDVVTAVTDIDPATIEIGDKARACARLRPNPGPEDIACPNHLADTLFTVHDWLRFAPVVVDTDGDGRDELVLMSLTRDFGLAFTHVTFEGEGAALKPASVKAYLSVDRYRPANPTAPKVGCDDELEFSDCSRIKAWIGDARKTPGERSLAAFLSNERALINAQFGFMAASQGRTADGRNPQDIVMLTGFADRTGPSRDWDPQSRQRRFRFVPGSGFEMQRAIFLNDGHQMRQCDRNAATHFEQYKRFQYPSLIVPLPAACPTGTTCTGACALPGQEVVGVVAREKCPSSALTARSGEINDIDLMLYPLEPRRGAEPTLLGVRWAALRWNEAAHPVVSSRHAREAGIIMVGTFLGGRRRAPEPIINVLRTEHLKPEGEGSCHPIREAKDVRQPQTVGRVPETYQVAWQRMAIARASWTAWRRGKTERHPTGHPGMYLQLPSVLAPFAPNGGVGMSKVYFSNTAVQELDEYKDDRPSAPYRIGEGRFRVAMVPLARGSAPASPAAATVLECAVPREERDRRAWQKDFLRHEPVLAGRFFTAAPGSDPAGGLLMTWRSRDGAIRLAPFRHDGTQWTFDGVPCERRGSPAIHRVD